MNSSIAAVTYESTYDKLASHRLPVYFNPKYKAAALQFINFLSNVGAKHGLKIRYRSRQDGSLLLIIDKRQGGHLDTLLQELILSRGLYYYTCSLDRKYKEVMVNDVIVPIYESLLEGRFFNPYTKYLRQHILAQISPEEFVPVDLNNEFSREYEILYRKWGLGFVSDSAFIEDLDSLITRFLLNQVGHKAGEKSAPFGQTLSQAVSKGIAIARLYRKQFEKVHRYRTIGLHRLERAVTREELASIATGLFLYFQYFDEFCDTQTLTQYRLNGENYHRIKYGDEKRLDRNGELYKDEKGIPYDWSALSEKWPCGDCAAIKGQYHVEICDQEECPRCGWQFLSCDCRHD